MQIIIVKPIIKDGQIQLDTRQITFSDYSFLRNELFAVRLSSAVKKEESVCLLIGEAADKKIEVLQSAGAIVESIRKMEDNFVHVTFWDHSALLKLEMTIEHAQAYLDLLTQSLHSGEQVLMSVKNGLIYNVRPYDGVANNWFRDSRQYSFEPSTLKPVITEAELAQIFTYLANEACTLNPLNIDYCITFQYVWDGCFARAHKMREVMQSQFNVTCQKIFNYGSLAVAAYNHCVTWGWHVAPVVTVVSTTGINEQYVIDPSVAAMPLTITQWRNIQLNSCSGHATLYSYDIVDGKCYGRKNSSGNYTSFDDNYHYTNIWLSDHRDTPTFE
ncbi:protein-glutamine glutaminase family protein [Mucilaginibacter sp.]|uniref:protein-glutamine glutaminase family protein n=1 Tax=Mucilaginibacter sp. TaxID=1882438 RepID=UPI0025D2FD65|nr:protein-glutamine glutaminase family protein [Mucilaginibacter sp.]